jgi:predicted transcriptional regulator
MSLCRRLWHVTFDEEDRFAEAVKRGEDALERGEYLSHEQVGERLRRILP